MLRAYGDGKVFGEQYGEGPVEVVWLHGWARRAGDFDAVATSLASSGVASVALDLPGFGASPAPSQAGGARHYAALVAPAIAGLVESPVVLVGHSFGGRVATVLAAERPDLVRAVVLTGTPLLRGASVAQSPRYRLIRRLDRWGVVSERRMEAARQRYGSGDYRRASGVMRDVLVAMVNEGYEGELTRIGVPVWLVWGALDTEVPVTVAQRAQRLLTSGSSLRVLDGVSHFVPTEAPDALGAAVREALA